jgi:hypothetical protein
MAKDAAITIRVPADLKQRLQARARRERRSLSAQALIELQSALAAESVLMPTRGRLLGRHAGTRVPTDREIAEVRLRLWGRLGDEAR